MEFFSYFSAKWGFPSGSRGKKKSICLECGRPRFNPWVGKIPWRRKWQPTLVFLPGKSYGQRNLVGCSPHDCRVRHDLVTKLHQQLPPSSALSHRAFSGFNPFFGKKKKKHEKDPKLQTPWKIIVIIHENWWCTNSKSQRFTLGYTYRHPVPHSHTSSRALTWEGSEPLCSQWQEIGNDTWTH